MTTERPDRDLASCKDTHPRLFFPDVGDLATVREAKAVCKTCQVRVECLRFAIESGEQHGIWGGMTYRERRRVKMTRKQIQLQSV
jgi:WhiB family redox-sensing transcriptional regulator